MFPLIHVGRPWLAYWLMPIPNTMGMWPQFRSPLIWDVFAVSTYATVSLLFWYVGLIPDLATLRDRTTSKLGRVIYGIFALGWRGSAMHWHRYETAYLLLAALPGGLWLARSYAVYEEPVFNPEAAEFLWRGNNPAASGTNFARGPGLVPVFEAAPESFRKEVLASDVVGQRRAFRREALRFIREQPLNAAAPYLRKVWAFLWFSEHAGGWYSPGLTLGYKAFYAVLRTFQRPT